MKTFLLRSPILFAGLAFFVSISAYAEKDRSACPQDSSGWLGTQVIMNECAGKQLAKNDAEMDKLFKEQLGYLKSMESKRLFEKAQQAFLHYRNAACEYEVSPYQGGSMTGFTGSLCKADLAMERNQLLKEAVKCRSNGCPN